MGSLCWKAISMDKLSLILGTFILISFGQDSLLSATSSHEKVESLVGHLDLKFSQMMKEQQEEIKQLQEENKQQEEKIRHMEADSKNCSQETLLKLGEQTNHVSSLTELVDSLNNKASDHEKSINVLRASPAVFYCGYRNSIHATTSVLTFDYLSYSNSNQPIGGLDPVTGIFTSPLQATYSVSWSLWAGDAAGDNGLVINLHKNGAFVGYESTHFSVYTGASGGAADQGGRTLIIDLDMGETLSMWCDDCSPGAWHVNFCVSLVNFNQIEA